MDLGVHVHFAFFTFRNKKLNYSYQVGTYVVWSINLNTRQSHGVPELQTTENLTSIKANLDLFKFEWSNIEE